MGVKSRVQGLNAAATAGFEPRTVWSEIRHRNRLATAPRKAQRWQSQVAGGNCCLRDCEWVYHRMTIAFASENGDSWQCEWTHSHKNRNLRVKIATHGIANKLNRMMSTVACLECHRSGDCDVLYMRLRGRTLLSRYWCGICDWNMQSSETVWCECRKSGSWREKSDWKFFNKTSVGGAARTAGHRYWRDICDWKLTSFQRTLKKFSERSWSRYW